MAKKVTKKETKPKSKTKQHTGGRQWFDGKDEAIVIPNLQKVWGFGGSDAEAAYYAGISTSSLSRYLSAHPDLKANRDALQQKPILKARETVVKGLSNIQNAQWFLERKSKKEFSTRSEHTGAGGKDLIPADRKAEIDKALDDVL